MIELKKHYFVTPNVIMDWGKDHQWLVKTIVEMPFGKMFYGVKGFPQGQFILSYLIDSLNIAKI